MLGPNDVPELLDPALLQALREQLAPPRVVHTLRRGRPNKITAIEPDALTIETERSADRGNVERVPAWMFNVAWRELQRGTILRLDDFRTVAKRSSAVFAVLAELHQVDFLLDPVSIWLRRGPGHVFVTRADLNQLYCDARLVPTDSRFKIEEGFARAVGLAGPGRLEGLTWRAGSSVMPYRPPGVDPSGSRPETWLANVDAAAGSYDGLANLISEFIVAAKDIEVPDGRRPVLAVNVLGSGAGGGRYEKGGLHHHISDVLHRHADESQVDLVLTTWEPGAYGAAQNAPAEQLNADGSIRRASIWNFGVVDQDRLEREALRIADERRRDNLVLFIGAGDSAGAGLPVWSQLLEDLAAEARDKPPLDQLRRLDLRDQASIIGRWLQEKHGSLAVSLAERMSARAYSLTHSLVANLEARENITTNFDTLFESAYNLRERRLVVVPETAVDAGGAWLLKLHGSIDRGDVVLTREDYLGLPRTGRALFGIVQALLLTRHMLFVGYSLSDDDFHQIVDEVRSAIGTRRRIGTALTLFDDPLQAELWGDDVDIVHMSAGPPTDDPVAIAVAARKLQIFLDLVAFESTDHLSFILDPTYDALLDDNERALHSGLAALAREVPRPPSHGPDIWQRVRDLLDGYGHQA